MKNFYLFLAAGIGATLLTGCGDKVMENRYFKDGGDSKKTEVVAPQLDPETPIADPAAKVDQAAAPKSKGQKTYPNMEQLDSDKIIGIDENYKPAKKGGKAVAGKSRVYRVRRGDTLGGIAYRHKVSLAALMKANNLTDNDAKRLTIGRKLTIPAPGTAVATGKKAAVTGKGAKSVKKSKKAAAKVNAAQLNADGTYSVKRGDSPERIARKLRVKLADLLKVNNLDENASRRLQIGQKLIVPTAGGTAAAPTQTEAAAPAAKATQDAAAPQVSGNDIAQQLENSAPAAATGTATDVAIPENTQSDTGDVMTLAISEEVITLAELAAKHNTTVEEIKRLNPAITGDSVKKNDVVNLPIKAANQH